jgi:hypothetical protein
VQLRLIVRPWAAALLGVALVVGACGSSTSSASPAASTPVVTPTPAAASSAPSPADLLAITIGAPYTLVDLPSGVADTLAAAIEKDMGGIAKVVHVGVRTVTKGGTVAAYLMVVAFPPGTLNDSVYQSAIRSLATGAEAPFESSVISNVQVQSGSMGGAKVGVFRTGDSMLITLSPTGADVVPVVTALIAANG